MNPSITLSAFGNRLTASPLGASLRQFALSRPDGSLFEPLWGYTDSAAKKGGQGDVLVPFPSRIKNGQYAFDGKTYQLELNDKEGPNAIHGFVRELAWDVTEQTPSAVTFFTQIDPTRVKRPGYPFALDVRVTYRLVSAGMECQFAICNSGTEAAPIGTGFHPYFQVGTEGIDGAELELPATRFLEFGPGLVPTGKLLSTAGTDLDFSVRKKIGPTRFNHCLTGIQVDPDGKARARLINPVNGTELEIWMDDVFKYWVVYSGEAIGQPYARRFLAIEPMTCATDAFNHESWGARRLEPGEVFRGKWGVQVKGLLT